MMVSQLITFVELSWATYLGYLHHFHSLHLHLLQEFIVTMVIVVVAAVVAAVVDNAVICSDVTLVVCVVTCCLGAVTNIVLSNLAIVLKSLVVDGVLNSCQPI